MAGIAPRRIAPRRISSRRTLAAKAAIWAVDPDEWIATRDRHGQVRAVAAALDTTPTGSRIRKAMEKSRKAADRMDDAHIKALVGDLKEARKTIGEQIAAFEANPVNANQAAKFANLQSLKFQIDGAVDAAVNRQALALRGMTEEAAAGGVRSGVGNLAAQDAPGGWGQLSQTQITSVAEAATSILNTEALSFWASYRLELVGSVGDDIKRKIHAALGQAVATGKPLSSVVQQLGKVVTDPEKFRHAGGRIFPSAANRLDLIVRTENHRMHIEGQSAFFDDVGITHGRWMTAGDDRVRKSHRALNGKTFAMKDRPSEIYDPGCRCDIVGDVEASGGVSKTPEDFGVNI